MAAAAPPISPPLSSPPYGFPATRALSPRLLFPKHPAAPSAFACRCRARADDDAAGWGVALFRGFARTWTGIFGERGGGEKLADKEEEWNWERWRRHFEEVDDQDRLVSLLKSQLADAVYREDYEDAAKLKVAIAAASQSDAVGRAMALLNRAVVEERYVDAAFVRDHAGAGLVGWWAGRSEDSDDPYGRIIQITAEHGKYIARSYSSRQLASARPGTPLFEVYFTVNDEGRYRHQAVYLNRCQQNLANYLAKPPKSSAIGSFDPLNNPSEGRSELKKTEKNVEKLDDVEDRGDDSDVAEDISGFQGVLRDMIPGVKIRVLKVVSPDKLNKDFMFKSVEQDLEEESDSNDDGRDEKGEELDGSEDELKVDSSWDGGDRGWNSAEVEDGASLSDAAAEGNNMTVKVVIGELVQKQSNATHDKDFDRVPAHIKKYGRQSFSLAIDASVEQLEKHGMKRQENSRKTGSQSHRRNIHVVMSDLVKLAVKRQKISMKMLKEVGDLIHQTLNQAQNHQGLSASTVFNRIEIPSSSDPLSGLYVGAHGLYTSEIIHLRRRFGQWQEDDQKHGSANFEVYEYVEALKLTGDPYVPAGQVAFRAKVGKQNQLPHKGIIPEEFGVVARYKGQGRLAEPGFQNPRWVDGELVILDGKYIKGGPVVGFVYWDPEYHFLVFFNRLNLQD